MTACKHKKNKSLLTVDGIEYCTTCIAESHHKLGKLMYEDLMRRKTVNTPVSTKGIRSPF